MTILLVILILLAVISAIEVGLRVRDQFAPALPMPQEVYAGVANQPYLEGDIDSDRKSEGVEAESEAVDSTPTEAESSGAESNNAPHSSEFGMLELAEPEHEVTLATSISLAEIASSEHPLAVEEEQIHVENLPDLDLPVEAEHHEKHHHHHHDVLEEIKQLDGITHE